MEDKDKIVGAKAKPWLLTELRPEDQEALADALERFRLVTGLSARFVGLGIDIAFGLPEVSLVTLSGLPGMQQHRAGSGRPRAAAHDDLWVVQSSSDGLLWALAPIQVHGATAGSVVVGPLRDSPPTSAGGDQSPLWPASEAEHSPVARSELDCARSAVWLLAMALKGALTESLTEAERYRRLLSLMGHEQKGALTVFAGYAHLVQLALSRKSATEREVSHCSSIRSQVNRVTAMIRDFQVFSLLQSGMLTLAPSLIELGGWLRDAASSLQRRHGERSLDLRIVAASDLQVRADPERLQQALAYVVSAVADWSAPASAIGISLSGLNGSAVLSVSSPERAAEREEEGDIFEPFRRGERHRRVQTRCSGLELYLARRLVELQRGQVRFESKAGSGPTFHLLLPLV